MTEPASSQRSSDAHAVTDPGAASRDAGAPGSRSVALEEGKTLVVRPATADDADALAALYEHLDDSDRYLRFFSHYRPPRSFFDQLATLADRGGYELVAVVRDASEKEAGLVAEAGYAPSNEGGDPELAITVAEGWRGWLGPFLLDALVEVAAARGVHNLRAEILLTNGPMLALVRARGYVTLDHAGWSSVSVRIGTEGCTPTWHDGATGQRVLVEASGGRWTGEDQARAAGLHVLVCPGPGAYPSHCPALEGRACPLAAGADGIIVVPRPDDPRWTALLDAHARLHPTVPVVIQHGGSDPAVAAFVQRLTEES